MDGKRGGGRGGMWREGEGEREANRQTERDRLRMMIV